MIINFAIAFEMVIVSLSVTDICLHKKHSVVKSYFFLSLYSIADVSLAFYLTHTFSIFGNGNGLFVICCLLLLLPVYLIYKEAFSGYFSVLSVSWVYALLLFTLSVHTSRLFGDQYFNLLVLAIQSALYAVSFYWFSKFLRTRFLYLLKYVSIRINTYFQWVSLIWILLIVVLNLTFSYDQEKGLKIIALLILTGNIVFSYIFLFYLVKNFKDIKRLQEVIYLDEMTGLCNRARMFMDAEEKIKEHTPFYLVYMDLNEFKLVNDSFGHLAGDKYLCKFASVTKKIIGNKGCLYRMSGDEFICLYTDSDVLECIQRMREFSWQNTLGDMKFQGFSVGCSKYPEDSKELDNLIFIADSRMYEHKRKNTECM